MRGCTLHRNAQEIPGIGILNRLGKWEYYCCVCGD